MPEKMGTPATKAAPATTKAAPKKRVPAKGEKLVCETCGISVVVDEVTGVVLFEELICCGKPMKPKAASTKPAAAPKAAPAKK